MSTVSNIRSETSPTAEEIAAAKAERDVLLEAQAVKDLDRLKRIGMNVAERLDDAVGIVAASDVGKLQSLGRTFERVSRAVRQTIALQHEVAGLCPVMQPRGYGVGPANQNGGQNGGHAGNRTGTGNGRARGATNDLADGGDFDSDFYMGHDLRPFRARFERVSRAIRDDLMAAGKEDTIRQTSQIDRFERLAFSFPHPALDACLAEMTPDEASEMHDMGLGRGPPWEPHGRPDAPPEKLPAG